MNQALKERFYSNGTQRHIKYVASVGGMTEEETEVLKLLHEKRDDEFIMDELSMDKKRLAQVEKMVGMKTAYALLHAVDFCIKFEPL